MTTDQSHPHHHHIISGPSALGVVFIVVLCIGFVTGIAVLLVRAVMPESHADHVEGTIGTFASRGQAREEARRRVGVLVIKEPCEVTQTPPDGSEDYITLQFNDSDMHLHLMPIETPGGHWGVKWTANLRGSEAKNREVIEAWQDAANGSEPPTDSDPKLAR